MTCYDLHSHSTASDGALSPTKLISRAIEKGVDVLALTDHDGTEGISEAQQAARNSQLTLIPG
ncbi:MAG: phosphatase, partial [Gammaproteobacteria bacterium]